MLARTLARSFSNNSALLVRFEKLNILHRNPTLNIECTRKSSFRSSEPVANVRNLQEVEIVKNPPEWKFVDRLLAPRVVPTPLAKGKYPSGWKPPNPKPDLKYSVSRTKNFMLPVYLRRTFRGQRIITAVRRVDGDIWLLEAELRYRIEKKLNKSIVTQVNEMNGQIELRGDFVTIVEDFLLEKGL